MTRYIVNRVRKSLVVVMLAVGAAVVLPAGAEDRHQPPGDLGRGAQLWAENCARCHNMRDPREFRDDEWRVIVTHMRVRAGFTGQDTRDMLQFLQAGN